MKSFIAGAVGIIAAFLLLLGAAVPGGELREAPRPVAQGATVREIAEPDATLPPLDRAGLMDVYKSVLLRGGKFYSVAADEYADMKTLGRAVTSDAGVIVKATKFALLDMDGDGAEELLLWLNVNYNDYYGYELLHVQNGVCRGYTVWYRAMKNIKSDGTFTSSSGAAQQGFGSVRFRDKSFVYDPVCSAEGVGFGMAGECRYFMDGESIDAETFAQRCREQEDKADAAWYELTEENIGAMLK